MIRKYSTVTPFARSHFVPCYLTCYLTVCDGLDCTDNHGGFHHHTVGDAALLHTRHSRRELIGSIIGEGVRKQKCDDSRSTDQLGDRAYWFTLGFHIAFDVLRLICIIVWLISEIERLCAVHVCVFMQWACPGGVCARVCVCPDFRV